MNRNHEFVRFRINGWSDLYSCAELSFLFSVVPRFVLLPSSSSYMATKTRSNINATLPREGKPAICSADDVASLPNRLPSPLVTFSLHIFLTLPIHAVSFSSVLVCLFHRVRRSTTCPILANLRRFVGFSFICKGKLSAQDSQIFYIVAWIYWLPPFIESLSRAHKRSGSKL